MCLGAIGVVTRVWEEDGIPLALVDTGAAAIRACLLACPGAATGASVLVQAGYVVEVIGEQAAADARDLRADPGEESEPP